LVIDEAKKKEYLRRLNKFRSNFPLNKEKNRLKNLKLKQINILDDRSMEDDYLLQYLKEMKIQTM
jgi:hypothetical protein